jgi:hypothetical protein
MQGLLKLLLRRRDDAAQWWRGSVGDGVFCSDSLSSCGGVQRGMRDRKVNTAQQPAGALDTEGRHDLEAMMMMQSGGERS